MNFSTAVTVLLKDIFDVVSKKMIEHSNHTMVKSK